MGLAKHAHQIDKAIFIASQSGYWQLWPFPYNLGVWSVWYFLPLIAQWFDQFPARALQLSSTDIPAGVAKQWAQWGKSKDYLWDFIPSEDYQRYQNLSFDLLSLGFSDDYYFGPPRAVKELLNYYPATKQTSRIISPKSYNQKKIGHFGFLKQHFESTMWQELLQWLQK